MPRPTADRWTESVRLVGFSLGTDWFLDDFGLWEDLLDFSKSRQILMRSRQISKRLGWSQRDLAGFQWDLSTSWRDQAESRRDLTWIRPNLNWSDKKLETFRSDTVELVENWFLSLKPANWPVVSGLGGRDPLPTCHRRRVGRFLGRIGQFLRVGRVSVFRGQPYL